MNEYELNDALLDAEEEFRSAWASVMRARVMEETGLTPRDLEMTFENFEVDDGNVRAYTVMRAYAENYEAGTGIGLMLYGPRGTGKSHLLAAALKVLYKRALKVRKYMFPELLALTRSAFADFESTEVQELWDTLKHAHVVALDDMMCDLVGSVYEGKRAAELLYRVLDTCLQYRVGLLITTNDTPATLERKLREVDGSDRIFDRLREAVHAVGISGTTRRKAKKNQLTPDWLKAALAGDKVAEAA